MHDYDVEALSLSTPPTSAVMTPYRPAVSVRNNGVHEAYASGYLRIYAADLLIFETEVYSAAITPGATGLAQAVDYWTPPAVGKYMIFGAVTCPLDQYEPNNNLAPVTINVTGLPPPTPPPVTPHAAQHEEGGQDEVSIDGLKGRAADPQDALAHVSSHQAAGADQLNVGALLGELAQDQPTKIHSNTKHDPTFATSSQMSQHQGATSVHTAATNLANRETTGPEFGLVKSIQIALGSEVGGTDATRFLARDRIWHAIPSSIPVGLICLWLAADPLPPNWYTVVGIPPPTAGYIWIGYNPQP